MKQFDMRNKVDYSSDIIWRAQYAKVKEFRSNTEVTVRKAEKSNILIVLNTTDYFEKLDAIVNDSSKFMKLEQAPTDPLKDSLNRLIDSVKLRTNQCNIPKLIGEFSPVYLYGKPKFHRCSRDPDPRSVR